ncbi:NADH:flavin oxidoreductase [Gammaproteobacteria bacterium]|nr:NADH:flavin oxidoreductase [Gammaproteobacteria bacterium]
MSIESLFEPFSIKNLHLKNRFVLAAMSRYKNTGGIPNADFADYHRRRAAGELGLTVTGATGIDRPASNNHPALANINQNTRAGWQAVVDDVHAAGGPIALQLWHAGALFNVAPDWQPGPLESPSGLEAPDKKVGEPMTDEQIADCIDDFASAAKLGKEIGFDAMEIHGAHGFLIDEFFWNATNLRTDQWGGKTLAERSHFALEVIKAVRAAVGEEMALLMRISQWKEQDYDVKLASTPDELQDWLGPLAEAGIDIFDCSQRRFWEPEFEGSDLNFAGWVKKLLKVPTITVGSVGLSTDVMSFFHGEVAERAPLDDLIRRFERGDFDLVAVGRALLADPDWIIKVREGRGDEMPALDPKEIEEWI